MPSTRGPPDWKASPRDRDWFLLVWPRPEAEARTRASRARRTGASRRRCAASFRQAAAAQSQNQCKVFVLPAVPPTELLEWVCSADVVGVLFQHDTLNNYLSTPNKFLEAMAAGVPSVCSDHPGMGPIARATGCGIAVPPNDISAITAAIRSIVGAPDEERLAMRARALNAAHDTYNWESQVQALLDEYTRLTGRRW